MRTLLLSAAAAPHLRRDRGATADSSALRLLARLLHQAARLPQRRRVEGVAGLLQHVPEARPLARWLASRSAGVKDLRHGVCLAAEDRDHDAATFVRHRAEEMPFLPHASYYFVAATLARDPDHPSAGLVGDLFVHLPSASGVGEDRHLGFPTDNGAHVGGLTHFGLCTSSCGLRVFGLIHFGF